MSLIVPETARPTNLHLPPSATARVVESDLYDICKRVAEISPRLSILLLEGDSAYSYAIMEHCDDGVDRLVFRVKELDGRVVQRLQKIMAQPLAQRYEELERQEHKLAEEHREQEFEDLYERIGGPLRHQLWHDGFIEHRDKSYPKRGIKGVVGHGR